MNYSNWSALRSAMRSEQLQKKTIDRATFWRILDFARPYRRMLLAFLALSVVSAILTVATPVLAGRVVDAIVEGNSEQQVVMLALLIAGIALLDAGVGIAERWQSARVGEGLILDLRRAVFSHVQKMPIAFFTRTRTGALVSRLNNDVIGAQRAFTGILSGVVSNLIALLLTLGVMIQLSWQITVLALILLPIFVLPARRMGGRSKSGPGLLAG
jgi:ATP-binding cassette, subfamily B, bacterial